MSTEYFVYAKNKSLYSKASLSADPWASDATDIVEISDGLYVLNTAAPYIFLGTAGAAASSDTQIATAGDIKYGTVDGGDAFMASQLHAWDWNNATTYDKARALQHARTLIDKFNFIGSKISSTQNLEFPRQCVNSTTGAITEVGGGVIPADIKEAAYLIADALLSGRDPDEDFESQRVKVETFGPVRTEYATDKGPMDHTSNLIPSPSAWARIRPWLMISTSFDLNRG